MELLCPACGDKKRVHYIGEYRHKTILFDKRQLSQCSSCKLIFVNPMPTASELSLYYKTVWLKDEAISSTSKDVEIVYQIQANERVKYLSRHLKLSENLKVLDVGSGFGYLYDAFKKTGLRGIAFYAVDANPDNLSRLKKKGIDAFPDLKEIKERKFDLVAICFVLEHINEPLKFMLSVLDYVKEGGYIFVDIPERDDTFKPILEPHVAVYTIESLTNLVNKLGLNVVHITGYGRERSKLISELNPAKNILAMVHSLITRILHKTERLISKGEENKIEYFYRYYKFDEEGSDRWWIRVILQKPGNMPSKMFRNICRREEAQ